MAIFNKPDQQTNLTTNSTIISTSTKIKGTINSDCTLHIDGEHDGTINAKGTVTIGRSGKIEGDVAADRLTITGLFHGIANCENVEIQAGGILRGKVISNNLTIDKDCSFEGESIKKSTQAASSNETASVQSIQTDLNSKSKAS
jgi:cytoskeletal protein CcmA (bactofilin family)